MKVFGVIYALIFQLLANRTFAIPTVPIVDEYLTLSKLCNEGGEDTVSPPPPIYDSITIQLIFPFFVTSIQYVAVCFANGDRKTYKYGECYPYSVDESQASQAVFCKSSFCIGK